MKKIGIVGVGTIANTYMQLISEGKINGKLTAVCSRTKENMQTAIDKFGFENVKMFTNYTEMLKSGEIDLVIICTPHQTHIDYAKEAFENKIHPLIEKPIAIDAKEAEKFLHFTEKYPDVIAGVAFCNRLSNGFFAVKELMKQGVLGKIKRCSFLITNHYRTLAYHKSAPWRGTFAAEGGGVLMTQAAHQLDIMLWLCGYEVEKVMGFCKVGENRDIEVENEAHAHMIFKDGFTGQFTASSHELPGTNRLEISGENGKIVLENAKDLTLTLLETSEPEFAKTSKNWFDDAKKTVKKIKVEDEVIEDFQAKLINDFIESVEQNKQPICTVREAVYDLLITSAIYKSSKTGQMVDVNISESR